MSTRTVDDMSMAMKKKKRHDLDNVDDSDNVDGDDDDDDDMLSNLPGNVLDQILIKLPLIDAVRTSILSTSWRHKWVTIPNLHFDCDFEVRYFGSLNAIIDHVLEHHKGPIVHFSVAKELHSTDVDRWVRFLLNHPVEHLHLTSFAPEVFDGIYSFHHLKMLHLHGFKLVTPPSGFKGFSKLVNVKLWNVDINLEDLKRFLSRCPMLERLKIIHYKDMKYGFLDIDAPRLKRFYFIGSFESICFGSAVLEEICILHNRYPFAQTTFNEFESCDSCASRSNFIKVFSQLLVVEDVRINDCFLQFLAIGGVPKRLPINLNRVTLLKFNYVRLGLMINVTSILCLLRSCPNLKNLNVSVTESFSDEHTIQYLKAQQLCNNVSLSHLEYVRISGMCGRKAEMEFVKLILLWATSLKNLVLYSCLIVEFDNRRYNGDSEAEDENDDQGDGDIEAEPSDKAAYKKLLREHKLLKKLTSLPRASARAVVIFKSDL